MKELAVTTHREIFFVHAEVVTESDVHYMSMCTTKSYGIFQVSRASFWMRSYLLRPPLILFPSTDGYGDV